MTVAEIQRAFSSAVLDDICGAFAAGRMVPSDATIEALRLIHGGSDNEWKRYVAKQAQRQGSDFLSNHLPSPA